MHAIVKPELSFDITSAIYFDKTFCRIHNYKANKFSYLVNLWQTLNRNHEQDNCEQNRDLRTRPEFIPDNNFSAFAVEKCEKWPNWFILLY